MGTRSRFAIIATVVTLVLTATQSATASATGSARSSPQITWSSCFQQFGPFQCGSLAVPLDYSDSDSEHATTISIAVARLPASDPQHRIGSLFINPGGPGGSGVDVVLAAPFLFSADVLARFDIVGFDPRGIFRSTQLQCFNSAAEWGPAFTSFAFPSNAQEEALWKAADQYVVQACERRGGPIIDHMSTANVARDLDRLRAAVGDTQLTYWGVSYGSYIGVTYANLFPGRVRALVVDGVLDPIAWSTGAPGQGQVPFSTRLRSDQGAQSTLQEFFRLCETGTGCAFAPHPAERFAELGEQLKESPLPIVNPVTGQVTQFNYSLLIANTLGAMYNSSSWPFLASFLADLEARVAASQLGASLSVLRTSMGLNSRFADPNYRNDLEGFPGVACSDSNNPHSYSAWSRQGALADEHFGYFGRIWTWISSICANWPGFDEGRYMGPFTHTTANPVLVIGNLFDPATRYQGAVRVSNLLPRSRLLTVHGWGHTSIFLSACADAAVSSYLVQRTLPSAGTVCEQDVVPFAPAPLAAQSANSGLKAQVRGQLIPAALVEAAR